MSAKDLSHHIASASSEFRGKASTILLPELEAFMPQIIVSDI